MSLTLYIGNTAYTSALSEGSLIIRRFGAHRSSFAATLELPVRTGMIPGIGQEISVYYNNTLYWGGILIEIDAECPFPDVALMRLRGQGYEQVLQRLCLPAMEYTNSSPTQVAQDLIENFISVQEPIELGQVDHGYGGHDYSFYPSKASSLMDYLANESGFFWWIDKEKRFYMRQTLNNSEASSVTVDLSGNDAARLEDLQTFRFRSSTAGYRNRQYAFNRKTYCWGTAENVSEIRRMGQRFGSGEYGATCTSYVIQTDADGDHVAQQVLNEYPGTDEVEFTTDDDRFELYQSIGVIAPICGIKTKKYFSVTEIRSVWFYDRFRYSITAKEISGIGAGVRSTWEHVLTAQGSPERED